MKSKVLVTGGSGNLGSTIIKLNNFKNLFHPSRKELNILNKKQLEEFLKKKKINLIIHTAALARMKQCEKNNKLAIKTNITGTLNIVKAILKLKKNIRLVYISTDGVYKSIAGNYKEDDEKNIFPYNFYGWTKLCSEYAVKKISNHLIVRGRFFNKSNFIFTHSPVDIYSSGIEIIIFAKILIKLIKSNTKGIINIGQKKISDYKRNKKYFKNIKPCKKKSILKNLDYKIGLDSSLNLTKMKKIINLKKFKYYEKNKL